MSADEHNDFTEILAKSASKIFHPLIMPVYGLLIIFTVPVLGYLPFEVKKLITLIVLVNNVLLPLSLFPFLKYRNLISSWSPTDRNERMIPLFFATLLYATTSYIIFKFPIPAFLKSYIFALAFLSIVISFIYFFRTISIHSAAAGAITALVLILSFKLYSPLTIHLILVLLVSGISLSSRLKLGYRNPRQVWSGFLIGFICFGGYLWLF